MTEKMEALMTEHFERSHPLPENCNHHDQEPQRNHERSHNEDAIINHNFQRSHNQNQPSHQESAYILDSKDKLTIFRNGLFTINGKRIRLQNVVKLLGVYFDNGWTFDYQILKIVMRMKAVKYRCRKLMHSNRNSLNMDVISNIVKSTSYVLINYAGNIFLNQRADVDKIRIEWNDAMQLLNPRAKTLSIQSRINFNGMHSFRTICHRLNAKSFSKLLRVNEKHGLFKYRQPLINLCKRWESNNSLILAEDLSVQSLKGNDRHNIFLRWYLSSRMLDTADSKLYKSKNAMVNISNHQYIPTKLPDNICIESFEHSWSDEQMNGNDLYMFIDGSTYFDDDVAGKIYGYGGGAICIYYKKRLIKSITAPTTTRTHINTMEISQFNTCFQIINNELKILQSNIVKEIKHIHIISDSQNCIKIIKQDNYIKDDAMLLIYRDINEEFRKMNDASFCPKITIHWVESHKGSVYNDEVDGYAKIAANVVQLIANNDHWCNCKDVERTDGVRLGCCNCNWNENQYISYETVKSEIKALANELDSEQWNIYKYNNKNKWSEHYHLWKIQNDKRYGKEIIHLTMRENEIRMLLYTNHLPLNLFIHKFLNRKDHSPHCRHKECKEQEIEESMFHFLFQCPKYEKLRQSMIKTVKQLYQINNTMARNNQNKKKRHQRVVSFIDDMDDIFYAKQFIFPSFSIVDDIRIQILKEIIHFILATDRINLKNSIFQQM